MSDMTERMVSVPSITRPIIGIENRTPQEVFDMMCDRIKAAAPVREEGGAVLTGISLDGQQGEPAGMMTVKAHFSDGSESVLIRDNGNVISHWKNVDALATSEEAPAQLSGNPGQLEAPAEAGSLEARPEREDYLNPALRAQPQARPGEGQ